MRPGDFSRDINAHGHRETPAQSDVCEAAVNDFSAAFPVGNSTTIATTPVPNKMSTKFRETRRAVRLANQALKSSVDPWAGSAETGREVV